MQPTGTISREDLGDLVSEYALAESRRVGFVGLELYKPYYVDDKASHYSIIPVEEYLKPRETRRAPAGAFSRGSTKFEQGSYACDEFGWEEPVDFSEKMDYEKHFNQEVEAGEICVDTILRDLETDIVSTITGGSAHSANAVSVKWSTAATATPKSDVNTGIKTIMQNCGVMPDTFACSWQTFQNLMATDEVQERVKVTQAIDLAGFEAQKQLMANYLGVGRVVVANAVNNGAAEGLAYSASDLWGDAYGFLAVTNDRNLKARPQAGRTFIWNKLGGNNIYLADSYTEDQTKSEIIRVHNARTIKTIQATTGYLLSNLA